MKLFLDLLRVACLATGIVASSLAQASPDTVKFPTEKAIESWLLSGDPRLVAWGAHYARVSRDRYLIPDLLSLASRWQPLDREAPDTSQPTGWTPDRIDARDGMAAVLDTLIQMKATVPADTLRSLAPDFGNAVAVFLSRMPPDEASALGFDLYRLPLEHGTSLRYVAAALLALHPVPGFAADLLANIEVRATVTVVLPGPEQHFGGGSASCCGATFSVPRKDWPAIGQYALSEENESNAALLLVAGIDPIFATRYESVHYRGDACGGLFLGAYERRRLIAEMLSVSPEAIPWQTDVTTQIEFQSPQEFGNALLAFVEEQQQKYRRNGDCTCGSRPTNARIG
jgi:hypothetical protein